MRILFLCKRRPQGKDLIERPYGRFFHIPSVFSSNGHDVQVLLQSHANEPRIVVERNRVIWSSVGSVGKNPLAYFIITKQIVKQFKPDWVVGFSDTYYGIFAQYLAGHYGCKSLIDAYDNYESYIPWCKPLHYLWRRALARADMISAPGPQLVDKMQRHRDGLPAIILPMAADPEFVPLDRYESRESIGLPHGRKLIGYCGAISRSRGIDFLFKLADRINARIPGAEIVLSGRKEKGLELPANVRWLGYMPDQMMPALLNSMDVLLVINKDSSFGQFSYPVKLYEAMQCRIPVVAAETSPVHWILDGDRRFLGNIGDLDDFFIKVLAALDQERPQYPAQASWKNVAGELEAALRCFGNSNKKIVKKEHRFD